MSETTTRPRPIAPQELSALVTAATMVSDALAVQIAAPQLAESLEPAERKRLLALTEKLRAQPAAAVAPQGGPDERARAQAFADAIENVPADKPERRELRLLATYTRRVGRMPSPVERAVFVGADKDASLESLAPELAAAAEQSAAYTGGVNWSSLSEDEQEELEALVERPLGLGFFAKRRGGAAAQIAMGALARWASRPPLLRVALAPEGAVVLPAGLLDDVIAGYLEGIDIAVVAVVAMMFASRRIDPRAERYAAWTEDGALLVSHGLNRLLPTWGPPVAPGTDQVTFERSSIRERVVAAGWLEVEEGGRDLLRVKLGARFVDGDRDQA